MSISGQLAATAALADQKQKVEQYKAALQAVVSTASVVEAKLFVDHSEGGPKRRAAADGRGCANPQHPRRPSLQCSQTTWR
jgi:hypothetical protein